MRSRLQNNSIASILMVFSILISASTAFAQTTSFTYQGRLTDGGTAANGNYDLQFALWNSLSGGAQVGSTQTLNTVAVSNGLFTVSLDFGANAFPGASRFLEISARPAGSGSFTLLSPRQPITSIPYAVRSLNAATADSVPASGVPAGSGNYIQNTTSPQASVNFNISGNGTAGGTLSANVVNATTQFNLDGTRVLSIAGGNLFAGVEAGRANTTGLQNAFFGSSAGPSNTTGTGNTFLGALAGSVNATGGGNTFVGAGAGNNAEADAGTFNTLLGWGTRVTSGVSNSTAIGVRARVDASNSIVLGTDFTNVGIGTTTPGRTLHVAGRARIGSIPQEPSGASVCFNVSGDLLQCGASSLRLKTNVQPFAGGLDIIRRLRPISFDWKDGSGQDIGLGAEDVAQVAPSFAFTAENGEVAGVKYERLNMLLINAVKEQQSQIQKQAEMIERQQVLVNRQQRQLDALQGLACRSNPRASVCKQFGVR